MDYGLDEWGRWKKTVKVRKPRVKKPLMERLLERIIITERDHWIWQGAKNKLGYGAISVNGKTKYTHRAMYEVFNNCDLGSQACYHTCGVTLCINPAHITLVYEWTNPQTMYDDIVGGIEREELG